MRSWLALGTVFGPFVIPYAVGDALEERSHRMRVVKAGHKERGNVDVLVGIDGSDEADYALHTIVDVLGPRLHSLALVRVVDHDVHLDSPKSPEMTRAAADLVHARAGLRKHQPMTEIVAGSPATALAEAAEAGAYDLLVVGHRKGALFSSIARRLLTLSAVPVLVVGRPRQPAVDAGPLEVARAPRVNEAGGVHAT